jgi:hypothetical protein
MGVVGLVTDVATFGESSIAKGAAKTVAKEVAKEVAGKEVKGVAKAATESGTKNVAKKAENELKESVHGNSKESTKAQHNYDIVDTQSGKVVKTGTSGGKTTKDGKSSYRGNNQANKWNKQESTPDRYKSVVTNNIPAGKGARAKALEYEKNRANEVRNQLDPQKHKLP